MQLREVSFYVKSAVIGSLVFGSCYWYLKWLGIPGEINKSAGDTAIILMGFSMLQSSLSYFFNFMDRAIIYRKYLGLIGFAFAIVHLIQSWAPFSRLFINDGWVKGIPWPVLTGTVAMVIFTLMALISNTFSTRLLGSDTWRKALRTGYIAAALVLAHVILLKYGRWMTWFEDGMKTPPSTSLLVSVFMVIVLSMRLVMAISLKRDARIRSATIKSKNNLVKSARL